MKVLIANRGEIAVRIIRACHDLGLPTVAVYSKADSEALHVLLADEAICIGDGPSIESYLKVANILSACEVTGADAIHPGYGFLSENAKFASICESCNLNFIGPSHESISKLGNKAKAKELAKKVKCPVIPGTNGVVNDVADALNEAKKIGFPLFIKASAGGGGKGIRIAKSEKEFVKQFIAAQTEAEASFNNSDIYLEKMIMNPRHIEVQIIADKHGHIVHLGERDCTIQRRRQKLIEETPSPKINAHLRKKLGAAAINIAKAAKYYSCGTVEFLLDEKNCKRIILCGYSYGAAIGCSAINYSKNIIGYISISFPWDFMGPEYKNLSQSLKKKLFIQGNQDTIASYENFETHYSFYHEPKKKFIIDGGDHFYRGHEEHLAQEVLKFYNLIV